MKSRFLNPPMVVACLALALSLGGTGYAVTRLPANSVGSRQVLDYSLQRRAFRSGERIGESSDRAACFLRRRRRT